jgi:protein-S-isoprenylcysteine O-methyltransferase Ste14
MEFSQFDRHPAYARTSDRRGDDDRRGGFRRQADRVDRMREIVAFVIAFCGGLVVLYVFFAAIGAINFGDAAVATAGALVLAIIWLLGFWRRLQTGAAVVQRPDRERRGF